jgi:hypothetical protein
MNEKKPRRQKIVRQLNNGERHVVKDADRTEGSVTELRFIHLARNGSIEVQYEYDTGVESTIGGTVLPVDVIDDGT